MISEIGLGSLSPGRLDRGKFAPVFFAGSCEGWFFGLSDRQQPIKRQNDRTCMIAMADAAQEDPTALATPLSEARIAQMPTWRLTRGWLWPRTCASSPTASSIVASKRAIRSRVGSARALNIASMLIGLVMVPAIVPNI